MNRPNVAPNSRHVFVDPSTNRLNLPRYNANSNRALVPAAGSSATNNSRKEVIKREPTENRRDHPRLFRPTPYRLNDQRFAAIGPPVDPLLRALKHNPKSSMQKAASDEISTTNIIRTNRARSGVPILHQSSSHSGTNLARSGVPILHQSSSHSGTDSARSGVPIRHQSSSRSGTDSARSGVPILNQSSSRSGTDSARSGVPILHQSSSRSGKEVEQEHTQSRRDHPQVTRPIMNSLYDPRYATIGLPVDPILRAFKQNPNFSKLKATSDESSTSNNTRNHYALSGGPRLHQSSHSGREVAELQHTQSRIDNPRVIRCIPNRLYDPRYAAIGLPVDPLLRAFKQNPNWRLPKREE